MAGVAPLLICWSSGSAAIESVVLSSSVAALDMLRPETENVLEYFNEWTPNKSCTYVPLCAVADKLRVGEFTLSVRSAASPRVLIIGASLFGQWDESSNTISQHVEGFPVIAFNFPKPPSTVVGPYAVIATAKSEGLEYEFNATHWNNVNNEAKPSVGLLLDNLMKRTTDQEEDEQQVLDDPQEDYKALAFNPKRDLPFKTQHFTFLPRVLLEIQGESDPFPIHRCLSISANSAITNNAEASIIRVKSLIETVPIEAAVSGHEPDRTMNLRPSLMDTYQNTIYDLDVSLASMSL